jgi:Zn-dependent peptidase ImmA (M78 family)
MNVPWISKEKIALKATALIENFQALAEYEVKPPIPVEDIIERYLGLRLLYDDLHRVFGRDVLGVVYVESKAICINERLFESSSEGRLVFTIAHEVGHWVLHRQYLETQEKDRSKQVIVSKKGNSKETIEWQADYFASCLLMPEKETREAFERVCSPEPLIVKNSMNGVGGGSGEEPFVEQWPFIAAAMCEAGGFSNVSKHAMIIRLQDLGLLINKTKKRMDWEAILGDE